MSGIAKSMFEIQPRSVITYVICADVRGVSILPWSWRGISCPVTTRTIQKVNPPCEKEDISILEKSAVRVAGWSASVNYLTRDKLQPLE
jgi:hypothetical protein